MKQSVFAPSQTARMWSGKDRIDRVREQSPEEGREPGLLAQEDEGL